MKAYSVESSKVISEQKTSEKDGLSSKEANLRLSRFGPNKLKSRGSKSALQILFNQLTNILTYILFTAILLSIFAGHNIDAFVISILLVLNISIGFYLEYRAEKRVNSLRKMISQNCRVIRDSDEQVIDTEELVPGDIVILEDGEAVPADIRIIESDELSADESNLTGESLPVEKNPHKLPKETVLADRTNMLYKGTHITFGVGKGVVIDTGLETEIGKISENIDEIDEGKSLFHIRTEKLMRKMFILALITTVATLIILYLRGAESEEIIQFSFAALISGIPEGLPSILTVLLSIASVRLASKNALLRNLPAIETLSTATTIITDKTGTLTENVMSIVELMLQKGQIVEVSGKGWSSEGKFTSRGNKIDPNQDLNLSQILRYFAFTSSGDAEKENGKYELIGYPTEISRYVLAKKAGLNEEMMLQEYEILDSDPYSQITKYKTFIVKKKDSGQNYIIVVGGAEKVLELCGKNKDLNGYANQGAIEGFRMQAIAHKETKKKLLKEVKLEDLEALGVVKISDPIRKDVPKAIQQARTAGLRVIMATGDHVATAFSIAKETGIIPKEAKTEDMHKYALSQEDIDKLDENELRWAISEISVFARVTPATKIKIAQILHDQKEIIAMTGDGVNDAPVLKQADIGISMGMNGTDLAKESSDLILLDDSFSTIITAIKEGRTVFRNMRRTSLYLITTNLSEDLLIIMALIIGLPLPLIPIQILWLNLVTDGVTDIALATEQAHENILKTKPVPIESGIITQRDVLTVTILGFVMAMIAGGFFLYYYPIDLEKARSMAFTAMVFTQLFNVMNMRSLTQPIWTLGYFTNKPLIYSILISVALFFGAMMIPFIRDLFQFSPISLIEVLIVILVSSLVLITGEIYKMVRKRFL